MKTEAIESWLAAWIARTLQVSPDEIDSTAPFTSHGLDSLSLYSLTGDMASWLGCDLAVSLVWEHSTIQSLAKHLAADSTRLSTDSIPAAPRDQPSRLSFGQERLWYYASKSGDRNLILRKYVLKGALNRDALECAVNEVIRRHEILRTRFSEINGQPFQTILSPGTDNLLFTDLSDTPRAEEAAAKMVREFARCGFDLQDQPLRRFWLLRHHEREHSFAYILHHLTYDARTLEILNEEIGALYSAYYRGVSSLLDEPRVQMVDFVAWQRQQWRKDGEAYQSALAWWKNYWRDGTPPKLELPFQWTHQPEAQNIADAIHETEFPSALYERLKVLCREEQVTLYTLMFAAFAWLLHQYTGRQKFIIGTYVSERGSPSLANAMGFFVNLLALRADFSGEPIFREFLHRVHNTMREATLHQHLSFEDLSKELQSEKQEPLAVEVILQHVSAPGAPQCSGLEVHDCHEDLRPLFMPWGLSLSVLEGPKEVKVRARFDANLYERASILEMLSRYESFLDKVTDSCRDGLAN